MHMKEEGSDKHEWFEQNAMRMITSTYSELTSMLHEGKDQWKIPVVFFATIGWTCIVLHAL